MENIILKRQIPQITLFFWIFRALRLYVNKEISYYKCFLLLFQDPIHINDS